MRYIHFASLPVLLAVSAKAEPAREPLALSTQLDALWMAPGAVALPISDEPSRRELQLPALASPKDGAVCIRFQARLHTKTFSGWNNYLALLVNGKPVGARAADGWLRILNRHMLFRTTHPNYPEEELIQPRAALPCLQVFFGPPECDLSERILTDAAEGYWYLLDIDDLVNANEPNTLTLVNTALSEYWKGKAPAGPGLIIEDLCVGVVSERELGRLRRAHIVVREPTRAPGIAGPTGRVSAFPGGGLQIRVGGDTYFVESAFSFPSEPSMGFNELACLPKARGQAQWRPKVRTGDDSLAVTAATPLYRLERRARWNGTRIVVSDAITNLTDEVLGLAVRHALVTPQPSTAVRLNGLDAVAHGPATFPENPTVFVAQEKTGLGFVAEDNAMRLQMSTRADVNQASAQTNSLGLSPRETYTLRWALYPSSPDYFDFINAVRRHWDVNYTVLGPFDFFGARQLITPEGREAARRLLARKQLRLFALVPWFEYYNGWTYTRDEYRSLMTSAMKTIKEMVPDAVCLACVETNLVPVPLSFFGDTIPDDWPIGRENGGQYGQKATAAMTAKVDASVWRDSCIRDDDGNVLLDCWYVQHYKEKPALNLMVYPEIGNHRHGHMLEQLRWLLDEVGFDGVYIDQFSMGYSRGRDRYSKERWDGRTVMLDGAGRVAAKMADLALVSAGARREWVQFVLERGKVVVCNSHPAVEQLQSPRTFRFMETQGYDPLVEDAPPYQPRLAKGQLHSPIGLGHAFPSSAGADFFVRTLIAHLRFGLLYYCYSVDFPADGPRGGEFGPLNHMFPFTPVELHEGWVLGEERLITCVSGTFPWPSRERPMVLCFDSRGRRKPADADIERSGEGYEVTIRLEDWWEVAVVEGPGGSAR
ncbi:MAG: hypothetical protein ACE5O2_00320 [Armatimonadota bacterium]